MGIQLTTLGRLQAIGNDGELDWLLSQRLRAALFVYLVIERRVSRESLTALFWPESDQDNARHALRQSLYLLRKTLGESWIEVRARELRVTTDVASDAQAFVAALERGDAASAARLYGGPFLDGVHLVDLRPWEAWVDGRRAEYARGFRRACREWLEARRAAGDLTRAVEAARRWVAPDPLDDEAQHHLIETLVEAGERAEAIRQYESYARLLETHELRPLDGTAALIERARSDTTVWPQRKPAEGAVSPGRVGPPDAPISPAVRPDPSPGPRERRRSSGRRRRPALVLTGAGALLILLGGLWMAQPDRGAGLGPLAEDHAIDEGERIVLADFRGPPSDPALGAVVTDALRIDLLGTEILRVLDPSEAREVLERMQIQHDSPLTGELAREVALREGVKAVLEGEIAQAGAGYVLTGAFRSAESGRILAAFRETAHGPDEVIPAIDRLSRQIRRHAGESLQAVASAPELARVTTRSLDALRVYGEASRAFARGDYPNVLSLLDQTLELDPEFAMAWRMLAIMLYNTGLDRTRQLEAATRAYELRHRLSPRERYLAEASYYSQVAGDGDAEIEAHRRLLELYPEDATALNNLGYAYRTRGDFDIAGELFQRAIDASPSAVTYFNFIALRLVQDRLDEAREAAEALSELYPDNPAAVAARFWVLLHHGDEEGARAQFEPVLSDAGSSPRDRISAHDALGTLALWLGRIEDARQHLEAAERVAHNAGAPFNPFSRRLRRAYTEALIGDPIEAARLLVEAEEEGPPEHVSPLDRLHFQQGTILALAGRPDDAEAVLQSFEADVPAELQEPDRMANESVRALIHLVRGRPEEAVHILDSLRASRSCRFCSAMLMGWALWETGRLEEAAEEWEVATDGKQGLFPLAEQLWTLRRLPSLYEELGDTTSALRHYRRLVEFWHDADPELQPGVTHARERIATLQAVGG